MKKSSASTAIVGAAFLMATSAIGPGFLTQTTVFTQRLLASFGFVIVISILLDLGAQLNIWRVVGVSGLRAQELANRLVPGLGHLLSLLIVFGGLAFNIGNIAGCALGLNVLLGLDTNAGAIASAAIAIALFQFRQAGRAMDEFAKFLGLVMIALTIYVVVASRPPLADALIHSFVPDRIDFAAIVTIVGGTVGGYISFAGAHRLLDAGILGEEALPQVTRGAVRGLLLTAIVRVLLFLAALGVVSHGGVIDAANPPASVFRNAAGAFGYRLFGIMMWSAAITSVVGAAYTSVSFLKSAHPFIERHIPRITAGFILMSLLVFLTAGQPVRLLVFAGLLNGLILPIALAVVLLSARAYKQPLWLQIAGWLVVAIMGFMGARTFVD